jgi:PAS domain S-box-containing protein
MRRVEFARRDNLEKGGYQAMEVKKSYLVAGTGGLVNLLYWGYETVEYGLSRLEEHFSTSPLEHLVILSFIPTSVLVGRLLTTVEEHTARLDETNEKLRRDLAERRKVEERLKESEKRYRNLVETMHEFVSELDLDGTIRFVNKPFAEGTGYRAEELNGSNFFSYLHPDDLPSSTDHCKKLQEDLEPIRNCEYRFRRKDGTYLNLVTNGDPLLDPDGNLIGVLQVSFNITERKRAEKKLKESYDFLQTIIDGVAEPIMVIGADYRVKLMNTAAKDLSGRAEPALCHEISHHSGKPCTGIGHPCPLEKVRDSGKPVRVVHEHYGPDGKVRYIEIVASPLWDRDGNFDGIIESQHDITDRKLAEDEIKRYAMKLEESNHLKDLFTDVLRHDLINPLQISRMYLDQLKEKGGLSKDVLDYLEVLEENTDRSINLLENAATYAKLETTDELDVEKLDLLTLLEYAIAELKPLLGDDVARIVIKGSGEHVITGSLMMGLVFTNLISNAIKYSPEDTRIETGISEEEDTYTVYVKDWGEGVPDEYKKAVFERFKRKTSGGVIGSGLGLAIAKRIVELHGGRIWVEDNPEGGSIFYVRLPKEG